MSWDLTIDTTKGDGNADFDVRLTNPSSINIDWGDSSSDTYTTGGLKNHQYSSGGVYTVSITGSFTGASGSGIIYDSGYPFGTSTNQEKVTATSVISGVTGITTFDSTFYLTSITSIPAGLFDNTPNVTTFNSTFRSSSITSIPAGLFDNTPNVTNFNTTFSYTSITSIPAGLFDNTPNVTNFNSTFYLTSITSIPAGLFDNTPNVTTFSYTFYGTSLNTLAPGVWQRFTGASSTGSAFGSSGATNLTYIPSAWGGGGTTAPGANPTVTTGTLTGTTTVAGDVTAAGGTDIIQRGVVWGSSANPTIVAGSGSSMQSDTSIGIGTFSVDMAGIAEGDHYRTFAANSGGVSYGADETFVEPPTVTTQAVSSITSTTADANGEITATGGEDATERGFVYDTTSQTQPGDVSPASSSYGSVENETGTFGIGTYTLGLTGLTKGTTYYVRAYAKNTEGYAYSAGEVSFATPTVTASPIAHILQMI